MTMYIGLDVHSKQTVYVAQDAEGKTLAKGKIPTTLQGFESLIDELEAPEGTRIGLETGTQSTWVSRLLSGLGMDPVVVDAREVREKARRKKQKSDLRDALEICEGVRRGLYDSIVYVPDAKIERLRRIVSRRRHFVRLRTSQVNAARFILRSVGLKEEAKGLTSWTAWEKLAARTTLDVELRGHLLMHAEVWRAVKAKVDALDAELEEALKPFREETERLMTVAGVGLITAGTFIAVVGDPGRFPSSKQLASYLGLVPSTWDSGERERHGHITERGSSELRALLCEAAHHASRTTHPLHPCFARQAARGGYKKAVVAVAHRLARVLYQIWKTGRAFDPGKLGIVADEQRITKTKKLHYRFKTEDERRADGETEITAAQ